MTTDSIRATVALVSVVGLAVASSSAGAGPLLPLAPEETTAVDHGEVEAFLGVRYARNGRFPAFSPKGSLRSQDLVGLPQFGFHVGAGGWVEVQATFEMLLLDETFFDGRDNSQYGAGDARLFTKVHVFAERGALPAAGVRFGTKLPNGNRADRLGTDETDFALETLFTKRWGGVGAHANLGILLLGNDGSTVPGFGTFATDGQDDLFTWGLALEAPPLHDALGPGRDLRLFAEARGWAGSRFQNDFSAALVGLQAGSARWFAYAGVSAGLAGAAEDVGVRAGVVHRLRAWGKNGDAP